MKRNTLSSLFFLFWIIVHSIGGSFLVLVFDVIRAMDRYKLRLTYSYIFRNYTFPVLTLTLGFRNHQLRSISLHSLLTRFVHTFVQLCCPPNWLIRFFCFFYDQVRDPQWGLCNWARFWKLILKNGQKMTPE